MDLCIYLPTEFNTACNRESTFTPAQQAAVAAAAAQLASADPATHTPRERTICEAVAAGLAQPKALPAGAKEVSWPESLRALRLALSKTEEYASAYKLLMLTALVSSRPDALVVRRLGELRDAMNLDPTLTSLIGDKALTLSGVVAYETATLPLAERYIITALCCQLLRIDQATHVKESASLRLTMIALGTGLVAPEALKPLLGQKAAALCASLSAAGGIAALLSLLRMSAADAVLRGKEADMLQVVAQATQVTAADRMQLLRVVQLEVGSMIALERAS